jgi:hypothetical protein
MANALPTYHLFNPDYGIHEKTGQFDLGAKFDSFLSQQLFINCILKTSPITDSSSLATPSFSPVLL